MIAAAASPSFDTMASQAPDPDMFTKPYQLTKAMHRDVYPSVDPKSPALRVEGKVVLITGAAGGIGYVSFSSRTREPRCI